jgi:hypothetical protein
MPEQIEGYTRPDQEQIDLVNFNKRFEELLLRLLDAHQAQGACDPRFLAVARTHFQEGFMALNRSVMQPERIPGDLTADDFLSMLAELGAK